MSEDWTNQIREVYGDNAHVVVGDHVPGWEGSAGPFPGDYGIPHVYARDIHSGAGNCVCGAHLGDDRHVQAAPGVPVPDRLRPAAAPTTTTDKPTAAPQLTIRLILPNGETYAKWVMTRTDDPGLATALLEENLEELSDHVMELFYGD